MKIRDPKLYLQSSPNLEKELTTTRVMRDVITAVVPATVAGLWFFGLSAALVILSCIAGAMMTEWVFSDKQPEKSSLYDASALLTGLLLGLTLPPILPLWMAFLGGVVSIGLGKVIWGGLGHNLFNPAILGRAFLLATFPIAMTTWVPAGGPEQFFQLHESTFTFPFMQANLDAISGASPLGLMKFQHESTALSALFIGNTAGSIGETSALLILIGGFYLLYRHAFEWRIPVAILTSVFVFSLILYLVDSQQYPSPFFMLFSGGLLFGTIFMATDPVTSPVSPQGAWIFGIGVGALVVLIRTYGGLPEGVLYAILLMNAATPLINRYTQPRVFGRGVIPDE